MGQRDQVRRHKAELIVEAAGGRSIISRSANTTIPHCRMRQPRPGSQRVGAVAREINIGSPRGDFSYPVSIRRRMERSSDAGVEKTTNGRSGNQGLMGVSRSGQSFHKVCWHTSVISDPLEGRSHRIRRASISCSHGSPDGGHGAELGRHGAMKPVGRACGPDDMDEVS
jgi:hypothetical protein